ncbi:MAG: ComF family protein [Candidatus Omnitrophica bacterium]|nr:ComF family protein [Candidatus Omnitrophota bacterium]
MTIANVVCPPSCLLCRRACITATAVFCDACRQDVRAPSLPLCQCCGAEVPGAFDARLLCQPCRRRPRAFTVARAPFTYETTVRDAIHAFKYQGHHRIGRWLALGMSRTAEATLPLASITRIVPVPMHWIKRRLRGDDPVASLAQWVAGSLRLPYDPRLLCRTRWSTSQTRLTTPQRFRNVEGLFRTRARSLVDRAVLLVDDVLTSGATAESCAWSLRAGGVREVFVLTAARAPLR